MTKKPSIPRRNRVNWHYVRDDILFSTIKVVLRHQNTQQYGAILPIELTTEDIRNTKAYKEYYAYKEISWNSSDDEDVDDHTKGSDDKEGEKTDKSDDDDDDQDEAEKVNDDDDDKEEIAKIDEQEATESGGVDEETESDGESEEEETTEKEEESFDPIPRTP
nr:hypothetical protein [Tanacetum cinerariifolium]